MFRARRGRTALTILGMGIGISAILFLVGLGYGLQNILLEAITTSDSLLALDVMPAKESAGIEAVSREILEHDAHDCRQIGGRQQAATFQALE